MALLEASKTKFDSRELSFELDMAYIGQTHTVPVPIEIETVDGKVIPPSKAQVEAAFDAAYRATFGRLLEQRRAPNFEPAQRGDGQAPQI